MNILDLKKNTKRIDSVCVPNSARRDLLADSWFSPPKGLYIHMKFISYEYNYICGGVMKLDLSQTCYQFFSTLANPTRLAILEFLREGPRNVTEISNVLNQEQSMISHNLKPLTRCGFVFVQRKGKERIYSVNRETMEPMFKIIDNHMKKYCPKKSSCLES